MDGGDNLISHERHHKTGKFFNMRKSDDFDSRVAFLHKRYPEFGGITTALIESLVRSESDKLGFQTYRARK
jgi:hypothetical protein